VIAYILTKRICLGLQRKDKHLLEHGVETGIIRQMPSGEFIEITRPVSAEEHAVLASRKPPPSLPPADSEDQNGIPAPGSTGALGKVRTRLNAILTEGVEVPASNGHGNGNGHAPGESVPAAVTSGAPQAGVSGAAAPETDETDSADGGHDQLGQ
jgi:ubiquinol-cytochrome c reductase cytochrome b subunit